jgi:uncharacterized protein YbjT (DUF2867 family)
MSKTVLVLGGTGLLGAPVARRLKNDGFQVRILARDEQKGRNLFGESLEIVKGDVTDHAGLERALAGCYGAHISVGGPVDQLSAENVASLAPRLGLKYITYISGSTVSEQNGWFPMVQQKLMAEKAVRECGISYTIFCPTWPMEQLPRFVQGGHVSLIGEQPTPLHWFASDDLGVMVSNAYQREQAVNKRFFVHGPEGIPMKDALERYCQAFHPEIETVSVMPIEVARATAASTGNEMLKFIAEMMAYFDQAGELGDPSEANRILGAPSTTLDTWIARKKAALS